MVRQRVYDHKKKRKKEKPSNFFHRPNSTGLTNEKKKSISAKLFFTAFYKGKYTVSRQGKIG